MTHKEIKTESEQKIEFDFFEDYNSKIEVVGFRSSWISEFKDSMKEAYENKSEKEKEGAKSKEAE